MKEPDKHSDFTLLDGPGKFCTLWGYFVHESCCCKEKELFLETTYTTWSSNKLPISDKSPFLCKTKLDECTKSLHVQNSTQLPYLYLLQSQM